MPTTESTSNSGDLIADIVQLPVRPGAAMRLLWMLDDTGASAADLGRLIDSDPALSTQVMRLANTEFYGLAGKVTSAWRAVTVLGLATLRAIATAAAFDLFADHGRPLPDDFWEHSLTTAAAASAIARRVNVLPNDAFSLGLLHDLGTALVCRRAPRQFDTVTERVRAEPDASALEIEREELGSTHAVVAASALGVMRFPADMVEAIAEHHAAPGRVPSLLGRLLVAADAVALEIDGRPAEANAPVGTALEALSFPPPAVDAVVAEVRTDRTKLAALFG